MSNSFPSSSAGFTLVEVVVAMAMMITGAAFALSLLDRANDATSNTRAREAATSLTRELSESLRSVPFNDLSTATLLARLAAQPGLEDSVPGGAYTIVRRDIAYTVTGEICVVDDPRDGGGDQSAGGYCAGSAAPMTAPLDRFPQDYKRASVTVTWRADGRTQTLTQSGVLNNPGAADAPSILAIAPKNLPMTITSSAVTSVTLQFTTSKPAASVNWTVDGDRRAPSATAVDASRQTWTTAWDISALPDGAYSIGGEAFDDQGVSGSTLNVNVVLNRNLPTAPKDFAGGRNAIAGGIELEWAANTERDIVGYEVRLVTSKGEVVVCPRETNKLSTECRDLNPPAPAKSGGPMYRVYAYDRDSASGLTRVSPATEAIVNDSNGMPDTPAQFQAGSGGVTLQWQRAQDFGAGEVAFYRVYRDGQAYANRYSRWYDNGNPVTWIEPQPDGSTHTYRVSAVDSDFGESPLTAGVTR